ncbi:MAG: von Willebrand factor type A domain-containing protein [bacterium]
MRTQKIIGHLILVGTLLVIAVVINAVGIGQLRGKITDAETGEPVIQASVLVVGTKFGAMTDFEGKYTIARLEPGKYTLRVTHLDYTTIEVVDIEVKADLTTEHNQKMTKKRTQLDEAIIVTADRDVIDKFKTDNRKVISQEDIERKPVTSVDELRGQVTGVVADNAGEVFVRGGRAGEVAYVADGVPIGDPLGGLGQEAARLHKSPSDQSAMQSPSSGSVRSFAALSAPSVNDVRKKRRQTFTRPYQTPDEYIPPPWCYDYYQPVWNPGLDAMYFQNYGTNPFINTRRDNKSTFAIDVDDASFVMVRNYLNRGQLPPEDAVRVEEFVNHFNYDYPQPDHRAFAVDFEGAWSPWDRNCYLLRVGVQGRNVTRRERKPANLVFVIDVSGSMAREDRLGLVKDGLRMMVDNLKSNDRVGIVTYGSYGTEVLQPTSVKHKRRILDAIDMLVAGGSTYAEQGIKLGYQMAARNFDSERINRIILCSDGVANVGQTGPEQILAEVQRYVKKGISLTAVGVGMGNYNDILMEKLANKGDGQYAYIDDQREARKFFVEGLTGVLQTIAKDVKIQVEFDPNVVAQYRLLGYENRDVADRDFRNDRVDGGEIGAGHQVTALYEVTLHGRRHDATAMGTVAVRYQDPDLNEVVEVQKTVHSGMLESSCERRSPYFKLAAVASEFSEILRRSPWTRGTSLAEVLAMAREVQRELDSDEVDELVRMIEVTIDHHDFELAER